MRSMWTRVLAAAAAVALAALPLAAAGQSAVLLPNGKQQFLDANGNPLAGGNVGFYVPPGTLTPKTTWQDAARVTPNVNPVPLDSAGEALIYGTGSYRQIVKDAIGNVVWDAQTAGLGGSTYGGVSTGSANAQVLAASNFSGQDGQQVSFIAGFTNTGAMTLNAGLGAFPLYVPSSAGPVPMSGGEVVAGNTIIASWSAVNNRFSLFSTQSQAQPLIGMQVWANVNISAQASAGALTITLTAGNGTTISQTNPLYLPFYSNVLKDGKNELDKLTSPLSLTISSGSTLGAVNATPFGIEVAIVRDGAGVFHLAVYNASATTTAGAISRTDTAPLTMNAVGAVTAEGGSGAADNGLTVYSDFTSAASAYSVIGYLRWTSGLPTAGTWTAGPDVVQSIPATMTQPLKLVEKTFAAVTSTTSGAGVIPEDDTIPQIGEGFVIIGTPFTPQASTDIICVTTELFVSNSAAGTNAGTVLAMYWNSGPNASQVAQFGPVTAGGAYTGEISGCILAGTTTPIVVEVHGGNANAANILTVNGKTGARLYGGATLSRLYLEEYSTGSGEW